MADLTVTATTVVSTGSSPNVATAIAGATITAGQSIYLDTAGKVQKAQATGSITSGVGAVTGVALGGGATGQTIAYQIGGTYNPGATVVKGTTYVVSAANAGGIAPQADLSSGNYVTVIGYADTTTDITLAVKATGVTI